MHFDVTYRVSRIACVVRSSRVRLCSLFPAPNRTFVLPFLPPLPSLIGDVVSIGLASIFTVLVSVMVSGGWLLLAELPWIPACPTHGSKLIARPGIATHYDRHHPQAHLFAISLKPVYANILVGS